MLSSVWNLCRACPMPTDEKLHTEYKQSFTWHQDFQPTFHEVVKKPPESDSTMEPAMPRRKKYPEVAYKTHEVFPCDYNADDPGNVLNITGGNGGTQSELDIYRARSIERNPTKTKTSSRSRSAEPTVGRSNPHSLMVQSYPPPSPRKNPVIKEEDKGDSTEYQSQFAWPYDQDSLQVSVARRFVSTGLTPAQPVRRTTKESSISRTSSKHSTLPEGATAIIDDPAVVRRGQKKTEYKAKYRPFSAYQYVDGNWKKPPKQKEVSDRPSTDETAWYKEVAERLKKADEYRQRSSGTPLYGERMAAIISPTDSLWNQLKHEGIAPVQRETQQEEKSMFRPATAPPVHSREKKHTKADRVRSRRPASADYGKVRTPESSRERKKPVESRHETKPAAATVMPPAGSLGQEKRSPSRTKQRKARPVSMESSMAGLPEKEKSPHRQLKHGVIKHPPSQERGRPTGSGEHKKSPRPVSASASPRSRPKPVSKTVDSMDSSGIRPRPVPRTSVPLINGDDGRVWLKAAFDDNSKHEKEKLNKELARHEIEKQDGEKIPEPVKEKLIDTTDDQLVPSPQKFQPQPQEKEKITEGFIKKPSAAEMPHDAKEVALMSRNGEKEPVRPNSLPAVNGLANGKDTDSPSPLPELTHGGHVPLTRVKSPEEMTGIKSPDPESWTVPLETGPGLEWMNGQTPTDGGRATSPPMLISSLRSTREPPSRPEAMMAEKQHTTQPDVMLAEKHPVTQPEVMYADKHVAMQPETVHNDNLPTVWSEMPGQSDLLQDPDSIVDQMKTPGSEMLPVHKEVSRTDSGKHKHPQPAEDVPSVQIVSPSSGRSLASDVLGRARSKFDQFWSKNK